MPDVLIWSNQQSRWWRANGRGYTGLIEEAGRYPLVEARGIVAGSTLDGALVHERVDPVTGRAYRSLDEVIVVPPAAINELRAESGEHDDAVQRLGAALDTAAGVTSKLARMLAEQGRLIEDRAQELAGPLIAAADAVALVQVAQAQAEVQRQQDLVAELRRCLAADDQARDLALRERDHERDVNAELRRQRETLDGRLAEALAAVEHLMGEMGEPHPLAGGPLAAVVGKLRLGPGDQLLMAALDDDQRARIGLGPDDGIGLEVDGRG